MARENFQGTSAANFAYLDGIDTEAIRTSCGEEHLTAFEGKLQPLITAATAASTNAARRISRDDMEAVQVVRSNAAT